MRALLKFVILLLVCEYGHFFVLRGVEEPTILAGPSIGGIKNFRFIFRNFVTAEEAVDLIQLIKEERKNLKTENPGLEWAGLSKLADNHINSGEYNATRRGWYLSAYKVRNRIFAMAKTKFENEYMFMSTTVFHYRTPAPPVSAYNNTDYSHGIHADNCHMDFWNRSSCYYFKPLQHRHYTAVLYLNDCEGGEFQFVDLDDSTTLPTSPGLLVMFTSGPENIHGVKVLREGERFNLNMWFSNFARYNEDLHDVVTKVGFPWYQYFDKRMPQGDDRAQEFNVHNYPILPGEEAVNGANGVVVRKPPPRPAGAQFFGAVQTAGGPDRNKMEKLGPDGNVITTAPTLMDDAEVCWEILHNAHKVVDEGAVTKMLEDLGVTSASDLKYASVAELSAMADTLRNVSKRVFTEHATRMYRSNVHD